MAETVVDPRRILTDAIQMELEGKQFFEHASESMKEQRAKDMFMSLVKQEQRHVEVLTKELSRIESGYQWASLGEMMRASYSAPRLSVFADREIKVLRLNEGASELEVIRIGMMVEQKSIEYYRSAALSSADPKAREVFNWLVGEEAGHLTILNAEYDNRGGSGFYYDEAQFSLETE